MTQESNDIALENDNFVLRHPSIDEVIERHARNAGHDVKDHSKEELRQRHGEMTFDGKIIVVRSDLNSPIVKGDYGQSFIDREDRIIASAETIGELAGYGAKVVVLSHQGRPGGSDFIDLQLHSMILEQELDRLVVYQHAEVSLDKTAEYINSMERGGVLLMGNVRKRNEETGRSSPAEYAAIEGSFMKTLGGLAYLVVNDAFSTSHRMHGSIVGFTESLNIAGRLTSAEILENRAIAASLDHPYTMLFGGVKITDYLKFVENSLEKGWVDDVLAAGAFGIVGTLVVRGSGDLNYLGVNTANFLKKEGIIDKLDDVRSMMETYPGKIILPTQFKVEYGGKVEDLTAEEIHEHPERDNMNLYGIGPETVSRFRSVIEGSHTVYIKGPPTKDDDPRFLPESKDLIDSTVKLYHEGGNTILSGGDTHSLVRMLGYSPSRDFSHATLSGGAAIQFLSGELMPGLLMLNASYNALNSLPPNNNLPSGSSFNGDVNPIIPENLRI